jgi:HEAT repeat protein
MEIAVDNWERIVADLHAAEDDVQRAVAACEALDKVADASRLPDLHRLLTDAQFFVREAAAIPIARIEGLRALPDLLSAHQRGSEDGHDNDGLSTVIANLVASAPREAALLLLGMLVDSSDRTRGAAAWLLGFVSEEANAEPLLAALRDPSSRVRAAAAGSLSSFAGRAGVFEGLVRGLGEDTDEDVRVSAASALGYLGDERALTALQKAQADPAERVRDFATHAIGKLQGSDQLRR